MGVSIDGQACVGVSMDRQACVGVSMDGQACVAVSMKVSVHIIATPPDNPQQCCNSRF